MGEGQNTSEKKRTGLLSWLKPSGKDAREQQREEGTKRHRQAMFTHTVNTATPPESPLPTSKRVAMEPRSTQEPSPQSVSQKNTASQKTPVQRFRDMTKNPPEPTIKPIYHPAPETAQNSPQPTNEPTVSSPPESIVAQPAETLPKKKERRLDPVAARESLKKAGWGTENPSPPPEQPKPQTSVAPFEPKSFPGVEKWQPGKGAIDNKMAQEIRKEVKKMPDDLSITKSEKKINQNIPIRTTQEKIKETA